MPLAIQHNSLLHLTIHPLINILQCQPIHRHPLATPHKLTKRIKNISIPTHNTSHRLTTLTMACRWENNPMDTKSLLHFTQHLLVVSKDQVARWQDKQSWITLLQAIQISILTAVILTIHIAHLIRTECTHLTTTIDPQEQKCILLHLVSNLGSPHRFLLPTHSQLAATFILLLPLFLQSSTLLSLSSLCQP